MGRTSIVLSDEDRAQFTSRMRRDGHSMLTSWMKAIIRQYVSGDLVPRGLQPPDTQRELELLRDLCDRQRTEIDHYRLKYGE